MEICKEFLYRNRKDRYMHAFSAYERRCKNRSEKVFECLTPQIAASSRDPLRFLDIGVGNGSSVLLSRYLDNCEIRVTAIDIISDFFPAVVSRFILEGIRDIRLMTLDMTDISNESELKGFFDLVLASNVLYRQTTNGKLLGDILCCCKNGGYLAIVHSPAHTAWSQVLKRFDNWHPNENGSEMLFSTLDNCGIAYTHDSISYHIDVTDILMAEHLTEEQVDFLLWILPKTVSLAQVDPDQLISVLRSEADAKNNILDKRDIIVARKEG